MKVMVCNLIQLFGLWRQVSCSSLKCHYHAHITDIGTKGFISTVLASVCIWVFAQFLTQIFYHFHQRAVFPSLESLGFFVAWHALFWMSFLVMFLMSFLSVFWIALLAMFWSLFLFLDIYQCSILDVYPCCVSVPFLVTFWMFYLAVSCCVLEAFSFCSWMSTGIHAVFLMTFLAVLDAFTLWMSF